MVHKVLGKVLSCVVMLYLMKIILMLYLMKIVLMLCCISWRYNTCCISWRLSSQFWVLVLAIHLWATKLRGTVSSWVKWKASLFYDRSHHLQKWTCIESIKILYYVHIKITYIFQSFLCIFFICLLVDQKIRSHQCWLTLSEIQPFVSFQLHSEGHIWFVFWLENMDFKFSP